MNATRLRSVLSLLLCIFVVGFSSGITSAATASKSATTTNNSTNTLRISPVRSDIVVTAGSSGIATAYVTNLTNQPVLLKPIENDFVAGDEKGTPSIILDENKYAPTHSLKRFMLPLANVTVPANGTKQVDVTIRVPKSAQAGGYFGALRFAPVSSNGDKSVNLSASVASLILMTIPGDLVETLQLTNFDVQQNGGSSSSFRTPDNLSVLVRFENKGNVQVSPFGQIYVQKGNKVLYSYKFNDVEPKGSVLPDSARRWEVPIKGLGKFGKYTVGATFTYGTKGQSIEIKKTIWIIPTLYIIIGLAVLAFIIFAIVAFWLFLRSYKRRILNSRRRY